MDRLKDFLDWHCENPHNVNFKMIVGKEDREDTLKAMREVLELLDTGLTPEQIRELKERDMAKALMECHYEEPGEEPYIKYICPNGCKIQPSRRSKFCSLCGQRLRWED